MLTDQTIVYAFIFYLLTAGVLFLTRKKLDDTLAGMMSVFVNFLGLLFTLEIMARYSEPILSSYRWFQMGDRLITLDIWINPLTLLLLFLVQFIGLLVQLYAFSYLKGDRSYIRFFAYLNLFLAAMLGIVSAGNLWQTFLFWELVGVASYLLIGFWYERPTANRASLKAFLINRIGDLGFMVGLFWVYGLAGTWEYAGLQAWWTNPEQHISPLAQEGIALCFLWAALGKSAQFPLQIWLPDAMEGPTPASALIHAATMVVAGIFLLARLDFLLTPLVQFIAILIGLLTAFLAALSATVQWEVKKVLAYSTISQLGLMLVGIGTGYTSAALYHLLTHAFFKAGLFLAAGQVIHHFHHQDMRQMGGLLTKRPYLFLGFGLCAAGLAGLPFFAGFLSKDTLLIGLHTWALKEDDPVYFVLPGLFLVVSSLTAYYTARQIYLIFLNRTNQSLRTDILLLFRRTTTGVKGRIDLLLASQKENEIVTGTTFLQRMRQMGIQDFVVGLLAVCSLFFLFSPSPFHVEESWFFRYFPLPTLFHPYLPLVAAGVSILSALVGYELTKKFAQSPPDSFLHRWVRHHFYLDALWHFIWVRPWFKVVHWVQEGAEKSDFQPEGWLRSFRWLDRRAVDGVLHALSETAIALSRALAWLDYWVVDGFVRSLYQGAQWLGSYTKQMQGGQVQAYFAAMILLILALMGLLILV